jgi:hypothetical protein
VVDVQSTQSDIPPASQAGEQVKQDGGIHASRKSDENGFFFEAVPGQKCIQGGSRLHYEHSQGAGGPVSVERTGAEFSSRTRKRTFVIRTGFRKLQNGRSPPGGFKRDRQRPREGSAPGRAGASAPPNPLFTSRKTQ